MNTVSSLFFVFILLLNTKGAALFPGIRLHCECNSSRCLVTHSWGRRSHIDVNLCSVPFLVVEKETKDLKVSSELIFSGLHLGAESSVGRRQSMRWQKLSMQGSYMYELSSRKSYLGPHWDIGWWLPRCRFYDWWGEWKCLCVDISAHI